MHVTSAEIQTILAAADADGLLGPDASYDATGIMDAGTSVFTTVVGGKTHRISAYALSESGTTSDAAAAAARKKLQDFQDKITDLSTFLGRTVSDAEAYAPTEMRVLIGPEPAADPNFPNPQLVTWPLTMRSEVRPAHQAAAEFGLSRHQRTGPGVLHEGGRRRQCPDRLVGTGRTVRRLGPPAVPGGERLRGHE